MIFDLARLSNEKPRGIFRSLAERPGKRRKFSHDSLRTLNRRPKALISVHYDSHHGGKEERKGKSQLGLVCATRRRRRSPSERGKFICNMLRRITSDVFPLSHLRSRNEAPHAAERESLSVYYSPRADEVDRSVVAALRERRNILFPNSLTFFL